MAEPTMTQNRMTAGRAIIGVLALWLALSGVAAAEQLYVNESGWWRDGGAFNVSGTPIQAAVDAAGEGDSIYVEGGIYNENVDVDEPRLTLEGEGANVVTVTAASPDDHVFEVTADYVNLSGFAVRGATGVDGIRLTNADYCNISENNVYGNANGIGIRSSSNNTLRNNTANSNDHSGICMYSSSNNTLRNNTANSNNFDGIYFSSSNNNILTGNTANSNNDHGIGIRSSSNNTLTNNIANSNYRGIYFPGSNSNTLTNNTANSNDKYGIRMYSSSSNNTLTNNTANSNNYYGIYLDTVDNNNITCNWVQDNVQYGFHLSSGSTGNNISYNNIIKNGNYNTGTGGWEWQFYMGQYQPVEAKHNYWGAGMNNSTIDASIYDDNEGMGKVGFYPFETEPVSCAPTPAEPPEFTTTDAAIALQIAVGSRPPDLRWDVSGDDSVTSLDALMILQAVMQAAAGNPEDPITGCGDLDQSILRMYDEDGDGWIDDTWAVNAAIDLDCLRITQSEYDQVKYAYEHNCPVEAADAPSNTR